MREGTYKLINSKSKTFLAFCFCFMLGSGALSFLDDVFYLSFYFYIGVIVCVFLLIIFWQIKTKRFILLCVLFFVLGGFRFILSVPDCNDSKNICHDNGGRVAVDGYVYKYPAMSETNINYVIKTSRGLLMVKNSLFPQYNYGDLVNVKCVARAPQNMPGADFRYDKYSAAQNIWSVCYSAAIVKKGEIILKWDDKIKLFVFTPLFKFRQNVSDKINNLWPDPDSGLMAGILYGSNGLNKELAQNFSRTGVSHIIAVSGYNVTIIVSALMVVLITAGVCRRRAFYFIAIFIILFIIFTGASASVTRAGIMGLTVLLARHLGRPSFAGNAIIAAGAFMILQNPYLLIWDVGFQLSFLATLGLVYISPPLTKMLSKPLAKVPAVLSEIFITTLSAIIATLPLIANRFGLVSIAALAVNLLILWIIPWLMLFGFIAIVFSYIFFPFGQAVALLAGIGLRYVIMIVSWFGSQPWSAIDFSLSWWAMGVVYIVVIASVAKQSP